MIKKMINQEVERIIKIHGCFKNPDELRGALTEELEEADESFTRIIPIINTIWGKIRCKQLISTIDLDEIINICEDTINELIQIAAICEKTKKGFEK